MTFLRKSTLHNLSKKLGIDEDSISAMLSTRSICPNIVNNLGNDSSATKKAEDMPVVAKNLIADVKMDPGKTVITLTGDVSLEAIIQACKVVGAESMNLKL